MSQYGNYLKASAARRAGAPFHVVYNKLEKERKERERARIKPTPYRWNHVKHDEDGFVRKDKIKIENLSPGSCYVYVYMNPLKRFSFSYQNKIKLTNEPFYIGKGTGDRYKTHLKKALKHESSGNKGLYDEIVTILDEGHKPIVKIIKENLSNDDALCLESELIKSIGREDISGGPLKNRTN